MTTSRRAPELDFLRAALVGGVVVFHAVHVFDPLDFGFNDNDALNTSWRAALSYVTGSHNMKVGYTGSFSAVLPTQGT